MLIAPYRTAADVDRAAAEMLLPPRRMRPTEAAAAVLQTEKGPWSADLVPYMAEPLDLLASREYRGIVLVGPARTSKTMTLILGGIAYVVTCSPADMLVTQMTQLAARDFSMTDLDRAIENSPGLKSRMSPRASDDNVFDKFFRSGMMLKIGWPAASQVSSKTLKYALLTDYDQSDVSDNVDGRGPLWDLAMKRTETYMSRGKTLAESSPSRDIDKPNWVRRTKHEAPPAEGILGLYNSGTRAMRYLPCQACGEFFLANPYPALKLFAAPEFDEIKEEVQRHDLMTLAQAWARVPCPSCGVLHEPHQRAALTAGGRWLHDGEEIVDGVVTGERRRSDIASFWLSPIEAAYQTWPSIMLAYLQAVLHYVRTGDESKLKKSTNTDLACPYTPRAALARRSPEDLMTRRERWERGTAPDGVRFVIAACDVQHHRFRANFIGFGVGLESWLLERIQITASNRPEGDRFAGVDPASYVEDWDVLIAQVIERGFPAVGTDVVLKPLLVACDSGGREGVTVNAYEFWRRLRARGLHRRFRLIKGVPNLNAPRVHESYPDARGKKRGAGLGDVPVSLLNVNLIKDGIFGDLAREIPGPGYVHVPDWVEDEYFAEITAERRTAKGWEKESSHQANEDFDLHAYCRAMCIAYNRSVCVELKAESIDWKNPPLWAAQPEKRTTIVRAQAEAAAKAPQSSQWTGNLSGWMDRYR